MVFSAFSEGGWDIYRLDEPLSGERQPWRPGEEAEYDLAAAAFVRPQAADSDVPAARRIAAGTVSRQGAEPRSGEIATEPSEGEEDVPGETEEVAEAPEKPEEPE